MNSNLLNEYSELVKRFTEKFETFRFDFPTPKMLEQLPISKHYLIYQLKNCLLNFEVTDAPDLKNILKKIWSLNNQKNELKEASCKTICSLIFFGSIITSITSLFLLTFQRM